MYTVTTDDNGTQWVNDPRGYRHAGPFVTPGAAQAEANRLNGQVSEILPATVQRGEAQR